MKSIYALFAAKALWENFSAVEDRDKNLGFSYVNNLFQQPVLGFLRL
jgi:hypothetical protein